MSPLAAIAVKAASLRYGRNVGPYASRVFAVRRMTALGCPAGASLRLYTLACQLAALEAAGYRA